jgi:hypothetical protein
MITGRALTIDYMVSVYDRGNFYRSMTCHGSNFENRYRQRSYVRSVLLPECYMASA